MTYDPNIPQAGDLISNSQAELLTNFNQLNLVYGDTNPAGDPNSDHYPFDDTSSDARKHRKVRLPETSATPYTPLAGEGVMYARPDSVAETNAYWRRDTKTIDYPMTPIKVFGEATVAPAPVLTPGSFNVSAVVKVGTGRYRFDFTEPFPDTNYTVLVSMNSSGDQPSLNFGSKLTTSVEVQLLRRDGSGFSTAGNLVSVTILRN